jgi:TonB family protein
MKAGGVAAAKGERFALSKVEEFAPLFITVRDLQASTSGLRSLDISSNPLPVINKQLHFSAEFEAAYPLEDVFFVLEITPASGNKKVFVYEVGRLEPRKSCPVSVDLPLDGDLVSGRYDFHVFVGGTEVFQSGQPAAFREEMLDRMIAKRVATVKQANPKPFFGFTPAYPAALRGSGARGEAVVSIHVNPKGSVVNPVVESASAPAFGEEAVATVRQWRFLPAVQDGRPVDAVVKIPFVFTPPGQ